MIIKICGMIDYDNICLLDKLQPDFMGIIFHPPSPRFINGRSIPDIHATKVGVFVNTAASQIIQLAAEYNLKHIQLHGDDELTIAKELHQAGYDVIKAFQIDLQIDNKLMEQYMPYCRYFLFDTKGVYGGGNGIKFNWDLLSQYQLSKPFMLSGGIGPRDAQQIKNIAHPFFAGIDLNSQFEVQPGIKDPETLKTFIDELR